MNKKIVTIGIVLIVVAIILGAFGAHALKEVLTEKRLSSYEVGIRYQIYHGLAFLILGLNARQFTFSLKPISRLLFLGVLLFSGSIYALAMQDVLGVSMKFLGPITPLGGVLMIVGWIVLMMKLIKSKTDESL